ncbi:MAG: hypothetical protein ACE5HN_05390 [Nitrospiria bacterium]
MNALKELFERQEERYRTILRLTTDAFEGNNLKTLEEQQAIDEIREKLLKSADETYEQMRDLLDPRKNGKDLPEKMIAYFEEKRAELVRLLQEIFSADQMRLQNLNTEMRKTKDELLELRRSRNVVNQYQRMAQYSPPIQEGSPV